MVKYRKVNVKGYTRIQNGKKVKVSSHVRLVEIPEFMNVEFFNGLMQISQSQKIKRSLNQKTMYKEIPENLINGLKNITKNQNREFSIAIDFERGLEQPQQMLILKGGKGETIKIEDFEIFGHTHPTQNNPMPSTGDLMCLEVLKPEFILSNKSSKMIILNIEDYDKFSEWGKDKWEKYYSGKKEILKEIPLNLKYFDYIKLSETEKGRNRFYSKTGVRIYPIEGRISLEMRDDPYLEKKVPTISKELLKKWQNE